MLQTGAYTASWSKRNYDEIQKQTFAAWNISAIGNGLHKETAADGSNIPRDSSKQSTWMGTEKHIKAVL